MSNHERSLMNKHLVFIYGTLRRGSPGSMSVRFPLAEFVAEARVHGKLYDLGPYPGMQLSESETFVSGEVYEVDDETLKLLDDFEESSHYHRAQLEISLGGENRECWTYEPDSSFYALRNLIASGDWIEYARARTPLDEAG